MALIGMGEAQGWSAGGVLGVAVLCSWSLLACGETARNPGAAPVGGGASVSGATSNGGASTNGTAFEGGAAGQVSSTSGSPAVGGSAGGGGGAGADGAAGEAAQLPPPLDISGRWAMFDFEDPVGVRLVEDANGTLTGRGCAVGAPDVSSPGSSTLEPGEPSLCGDSVGAVSGNRAAFGFTFWSGSGSYATDVTISSDLQRMTGVFENGSAADDGAFRVSWLRVAADQLYLERPSPSFGEALDGTYDLALEDAGAEGQGGSEYVAGKTYRLACWRGAIRGDLGAFWPTELTEASDGRTVHVGPVSATSPELPVEMQLDFVPQGFTRVTATTASGHTYVFAATLVAHP
ncbi:MAG: hypothetical protein ABUL60_09445 [Myxococcales bacterium]